MSALWTPRARTARPKPSRELREGTREWEAQVLAVMHQEGGILDYWNRELEKIDRNLRLMQAQEGAHVAGVIPGFYHLVRLREGDTFLMVMPLRNPVNGGFLEPSDAMLRGLRACDLQNHRAVADRRKADEAAERAKERASARQDEELRDEAVERWDAATRTQISMNRDTPWSQNNSPAARRARGEMKR